VCCRAARERDAALRQPEAACLEDGGIRWFFGAEL